MFMFCFYTFMSPPCLVYNVIALIVSFFTMQSAFLMSFKALYKINDYYHYYYYYY